MKIEYSSNNSGGGWWLKDEDWTKLEEAGWTVKWNRGKEDILGKKRERWLGALATRAEKDFATPKEAIQEFETITCQDASDGGCNCCGPPHSFSWRDDENNYDYASGEDCLRILHNLDELPSLRDMIEKNQSSNQTTKKGGS